MTNILSTISEMGFTQTTPAGPSSMVNVFLDPTHTRQIGVYRADHAGNWGGWGWVEVENGRQDFRGPAWGEFLAALADWQHRIGEVL